LSRKGIEVAIKAIAATLKIDERFMFNIPSKIEKIFYLFTSGSVVIHLQEKVHLCR
jgi:hypothetical protein